MCFSKRSGFSIFGVGVLACFYANAQDTAGGKIGINMGVVGGSVATTMATPLKFQVVKQRRINLGNRMLFLNRVNPVVLPEFPREPSPTPARTAEEIAEAEAAWTEGPQKGYEILFGSATVYDRQVTEFTWRGEGGEYRIFSNMDFNYLPEGVEFETETTVYMLMLALDNETRGPKLVVKTPGDLPAAWKDIPLPEAFASTRSEYAVVEDQHHVIPKAEELKALDALHVFYDANKPRLMAEYKSREVAGAERARYLKEHPPVPKDTVINYWVGKGGTGSGILDQQSMGGKL